jgi:hypothetical protein
VLASHGHEWQEVGGGRVVDSKYVDGSPMVALDATHICALALNTVRCSTNGGTWQTLPSLNNGNGSWEIYFLSLYQGNLYIIGSKILNRVWLGSGVLSCSVESCTNWQLPNELYTGSGFMEAMFESIAYMQNSTGVYYQESDDSWQNYGHYTVANPNNEFDTLMVNNAGAFVLPVLNDRKIPYVQQVYYNGTIGGSFINIGNILVSNGNGSRPQLVINKNTIYVNAEDGNVYTSTASADYQRWSPFIRIGQNNPPLNHIYIHNDKLYATATYGTGQAFSSQIYTYSLIKH